MTIEKITLCNLNSIQGEQTIDFTKEPLRSAGLFAITGDTGSGKSTLLDAICLALYGKAPRFDDAERLPAANVKKAEEENLRLQAGDPRNMLRRGEREGYAIVEFTARDGNLFEASWRLRRKRTGTIDRAAHSLKRLSPKRETISTNDVAQSVAGLIGLDYLQFSRTVLLAQNSFANFLKARRGEKSALLERLTGTEIYGTISQKIYQLNEDARQRMLAIDNQIEGILRDRLDAEDLAEKEQLKAFLTTTCKNADNEVELLKKQTDWLQRNEQAEKALQECENNFNEAYKACVAARNDELRIERYDAVLCVQPLFQEISVRKQDIESLKLQEEQIARKIADFHAAIQQAGQALNAAHESTLKAENNLTQRRPVINRGHTLAGEIKEGQEQLAKAAEAVQEMELLLQKRQNQLATKSEELDKTCRQLEKLQLHRQELSVHKMMFEKFDLIKDKLNQLDTETQRNERDHKKATELQKRLASFGDTAEKLAHRQQELQGRLNALKSELHIHRQTNSGHNSEQIQQRFTENRNRLLRLEHAATLWKRITEGYEEINEKQAEIKRQTVEQEQTLKDIQRLEQEKQVAEEVFKRLNIALTLSHSENIVELRKQLKEGTACPVCGATHHPYHTETERELGELLNNIEKEFLEAKDALKAKTQALEALHRKLASGEGKLAADRQAMEQRIRRQTCDQEEWKLCASLDPTFSDCSANVNREARRLMIELHADNAKKAAAEAEQELKTYNYHQQKINRLNEEIAALSAQMEGDLQQLQSLSTQQQITSNSLEELQNSLHLSEKTCSQLYIDLDEMVTFSAWFSSWKNNPDGFRMRLINLHHDWQQTCREADACTHREQLLREEHKACTQNFAETQKTLAKAKDNHLSVRESLQRKEEEMARLFGHSTPEAEEERLQKWVNEARMHETKCREAYARVEADINQLRGAQQKAFEDRMTHQEEYAAKSHELDIWLSRFNRSHSPMQMQELEEIFSERTDWKALRGQLDDKRRQLTLAEHRLQSARNELLKIQNEAVRPKDDAETSPAMLADSLERAQAEATQLHEKLSAVNVTLMKHYNCIEAAGAMGEKAEMAHQDFEHWNRLNTLLGSADGKKFREWAQSYTFTTLVAHANWHLRQLSPRYELKTQPGTLFLTVIDHDLFDEERHVQSLSGGETFVACLALALGLSSISCNQIHIGSLFIDEGFGHLDQDSLQLVMDALARLETTQGRKVGVVSHTAQIRSQISPQIRLVKRSGGKSKVEVG